MSKSHACCLSSARASCAEGLFHLTAGILGVGSHMIDAAALAVSVRKMAKCMSHLISSHHLICDDCGTIDLRPGKKRRGSVF